MVFCNGYALMKVLADVKGAQDKLRDVAIGDRGN